MTHVLVIDDDPMLRRTLTINLVNRGHRVSEAGSAATALDLTRRDPPDVVLLDLGLPDVDGLDLISAILSELPALPIIVVSARTDTLSRVIARDRGAVDYITKPFTITNLLTRLLSATARPRETPGRDD